MKIRDLKLLIDCACGSGDTTVLVADGEVAAKKRLLRLKLIVEHPQWKNVVRITDDGEKFVGHLLTIEP